MFRLFTFICGLAFVGCSTPGSFQKAVDRNIENHSEGFWECYQKIVDPPSLAAIRMDFVVNPVGRAIGVVVGESNIRSIPFEDCMLEEMRALRFQPSDESAGTRVNYMFKFRAPKR